MHPLPHRYMLCLISSSYTVHVYIGKTFVCTLHNKKILPSKIWFDKKEKWPIFILFLRLLWGKQWKSGADFLSASGTPLEAQVSPSFGPCTCKYSWWRITNKCIFLLFIHKPHFSFLISHFSFLISHFPFLISYFPFPIFLEHFLYFHWEKQ